MKILKYSKEKGYTSIMQITVVITFGSPVAIAISIEYALPCSKTKSSSSSQPLDKLFMVAHHHNI